MPITTGHWFQCYSENLEVFLIFQEKNQETLSAIKLF